MPSRGRGSGLEESPGPPRRCHENLRARMAIRLRDVPENSGPVRHSLSRPGSLQNPSSDLIKIPEFLNILLLMSYLS